MSTKQSNIPNLDAMTQEELRGFWHQHQRGINCKALFPEGGRGTVTATKNLASYAINKAAAMVCREDGNIQQALMYEGICDKIYNDLPLLAKW